MTERERVIADYLRSLVPGAWQQVIRYDPERDGHEVLWTWKDGEQVKRVGIFLDRIDSLFKPPPSRYVQAGMALAGLPDYEPELSECGKDTLSRFAVEVVSTMKKEGGL